MRSILLFVLPVCFIALQANAQVERKSVGYHDIEASLTTLQNDDVIYAGHKVMKYDHLSASWSQTTSLNIPRTGHNSLLLRDGRLLILGGWTKTGTFVNQPEILNPKTQSWTLLNPAPRMHSSGALVQISANEVLVIGRSKTAIDYSCNEADIFNLSTQTWDSVGAPNIYCLDARAFLLPSGKVMALSQVNYFHPHVFDLKTRNWKEVAAPNAFSGIALNMADGSVFVASGKALQKWNESSTSWIPVADLPHERAADNNLGFGLPSGKIVLYGYRHALNWYDGEVYDLASNKWTQLPSMVSGINHSVIKGDVLPHSNKLMVIPGSYAAVSELTTIE